MAMKSILSLLITLVLLGSLQAQVCDCAKDFQWIKEVFEKNDAGFPWLIEKFGNQHYEQFSDSIKGITVGITMPSECLEILKTWTSRLRKGHIGVALTSKYAKSIDLSANWEKLSIDTLGISKGEDPLEGIWKTSGYTIAISKAERVNRNSGYVGVIIKSENPSWTPGMVKLEINANQRTGKFYMGDFSKVEMKVSQPNRDFIRMGFIYLSRRGEEPDFQEWEIPSNGGPRLFRLSEKTLLLRIPSFNVNQKAAIDSVLKANHGQITSHKNLIIDLRDNGGGGDASFKELIPYIYTNPIKVVHLEFLSTPLNNSHWRGSSRRKLDKHLGEFVSFSKKRNFNIIDNLKAYPEPQRIFILVNEQTGSTAEQFLLAARQSSKVRLYGTNTFGALDVSNVSSVESADGFFRLNYSRSRTKRPPEDRIDGIGIKPNVEIPYSVPIDKWVSFVVKEIEAN